LAPGVIITPVQLETMHLTVSMGRLGTADECVGDFLYLVSEKLSGYVTGQIIEVNGGQYMP
jgi:3-oxoacyl-[acyl-carrier protein] reductase